MIQRLCYGTRSKRSIEREGDATFDTNNTTIQQGTLQMIDNQGSKPHYIRKSSIIPELASASLLQITTSHPYAKIIPVPNAQETKLRCRAMHANIQGPSGPPMSPPHHFLYSSTNQNALYPSKHSNPHPSIDP